MESLFLIAPIAAIFCALAIAAWLWATQNGQYDDLDREARRILENDPAPEKTPAANRQTNHHGE